MQTQSKIKLSDSYQFEDEINKIFQLIDIDKVGHIPVSYVLAFTEDIRQSKLNFHSSNAIL